MPYKNPNDLARAINPDPKINPYRSSQLIRIRDPEDEFAIKHNYYPFEQPETPEARDFFTKNPSWVRLVPKSKDWSEVNKFYDDAYDRGLSEDVFHKEVADEYLKGTPLADASAAIIKKYRDQWGIK